jgi:hypothetical protein
MITLASDCLLFRLASGESIPFSAEMISGELLGGSITSLDPEFLRHAAHAVFHYFRRDQGRQTVSVGEFTEALEKVLRGLALDPACVSGTGPEPMRELDLCRLAEESGDGCELFFFPRLRNELRSQLTHGPRVLRFHGLRCCVKRLTGARRWTGRCRDLEEQIVEFLRECSGAEAGEREFSLVVE